ncbi:cyclophilin-like domain-containing protein [Russula vinacea]|nr:cyclophilin-like domain-containing protein [Russula vinacea]
MTALHQLPTDMASFLRRFTTSASATKSPLANVFFNVAIDSKPAGRIVFRLYDDVVPRTAQNFRELATGQHGFGYTDSSFHRIIPNFMVQGGDFTRHDGLADARSMVNVLKMRTLSEARQGGLLSMANAGPDTNGSQFFITTAVTSWLDKRHVVFGEVVDGMDVVRVIEDVGTTSGVPKQKVVITSSGVVRS